MNLTDQEKVKKYIAAHQLIKHDSQPGNLIADIYIGPEVEVDRDIYLNNIMLK